MSEEYTTLLNRLETILQMDNDQGQDIHGNESIVIDDTHQNQDNMSSGTDEISPAVGSELALGPAMRQVYYEILTLLAGDSEAIPALQLSDNVVQIEESILAKAIDQWLSKVNTWKTEKRMHAIMKSIKLFDRPFEQCLNVADFVNDPSLYAYGEILYALTIDTQTPYSAATNEKIRSMMEVCNAFKLTYEKVCHEIWTDDWEVNIPNVLQQTIRNVTDALLLLPQLGVIDAPPTDLSNENIKAYFNTSKKTFLRNEKCFDLLSELRSRLDKCISILNQYLTKFSAKTKRRFDVDYLLPLTTSRGIQLLTEKTDPYKKFLSFDPLSGSESSIISRIFQSLDGHGPIHRTSRSKNRRYKQILRRGDGNYSDDEEEDSDWLDETYAELRRFNLQHKQAEEIRKIKGHATRRNQHVDDTP